ncbi:Arginine--tRNA ligase [Nymphon striatum]|nr:Arginine--tRNA ligase [Nymphon striatum]
MIYVLGADHSGYAKRLKAVCKAVAGDKAELDVLFCQLVKLMRDGEPFKMSKRAGDFITLPRLLRLNEDLGAAFASEFEQIASQQPEEAVDAFPIEEPMIAATAEPVLQEYYSGCFEEDLDTMAHDPGHVGSVEEIAAVETGAVVANENGGGMKFAIAALVLALFAGAIAAGYGFLGGDNPTVATGTPEIIKADADPVKVKPKDPGGLVPENQDNASYVDIGGENSAAVSQEKLNSQTEEPLILNTGNTENIENTEVADAPKSDDRLTSSEDTGATPNATNSAVLPKVVQTVVVKPDGTIIAKPVTPKPVETALNEVKIDPLPKVEPKPVSTQVIKKPEAIDGAKSTGDITVPVASPLPKPVVKPKPAPAKKVAAAPKPKKPANTATAKSEWVVQVSSQRTPAAAQSSFSNMRNKYSVLQGRAMSIQRAQVNGTTYYRVRVQTASRADANQLCTSLATAGGSCFVTR